MGVVWGPGPLPRVIGPLPPDLVDASREERFRAHIRQAIDAEHRDFLATKDPQYAVDAYCLSRSIGDPPPEWFLEFLDGVIDRFHDSFRTFMQNPQNAPKPDEALARAFVKKTVGQGTIWTKRLLKRRMFDIGMGICDAIESRKQQRKAVNEKAALSEFLKAYNDSHTDEGQISLSTARREWVRFRKTFPEEVAAAWHPLKPISRNTPNS